MFTLLRLAELLPPTGEPPSECMGYKPQVTNRVSRSMLSPKYFEHLDVPASVSFYAAAALAVIFLAIMKFSQPSKLDAIPTVGSSSWFGSWWAGVKYLTNAVDIMQEGYEKHKLAPFKVAELRRWTVVFSSREHVEEVRRAPDDELSLWEGLNDELQMGYTMGPEVSHDPFQVSIVNSKLTPNIEAIHPDIRAEVVRAFDEVLDLRDSEWKNVPAFSTMQKVICRTSNRLFVGDPLCRNPEWIDLIMQSALGVVKGATIIGLFPDLLKPMATLLLTNANQINQRARELLRPTIEERQRYLKEYGNEWADKPNDFLSWLMDEAEGPEMSVKSLTARILALNLASNTTSVSFTHVLFYLAASPQYIQPLREEVQGIVENEGWSKVAVDKMRKIDSFLKECQRLEGFGAQSLVRKALKDYTFTDGTFVPKGTMMLTAARPIHLDEASYENACAFEPFRFSDLREDSGEEVKHHLAAPSAKYLSFGYGRHACPGRFFAANQMKTMLAHIVMTYDIKLEEHATRPETRPFATIMVPNLTAGVMFRKRAD